MPLNSHLYINIILFILFLSSAITDMRNQKIYNVQTYTAILMGLCLNGIHFENNGFMFSLTGLMVGFVLLFPFYLCGGMGAGDVKYLAAIGALKGTCFVLETMYYSALIGGCMALSLIVWQGCFWETIKNSAAYIFHPIKTYQKDISNPQYLPFGVAISIGCALTLFGGMIS